MHAGVRPQSKVAHWRWLLGSGPKVKSLATVLWRQTQELRQTQGLRQNRELRQNRGLRLNRGTKH